MSKPIEAIAAENALPVPIRASLFKALTESVKMARLIDLQGVLPAGLDRDLRDKVLAEGDKVRHSLQEGRIELAGAILEEIGRVTEEAFNEGYKEGSHAMANALSSPKPAEPEGTVIKSAEPEGTVIDASFLRVGDVFDATGGNYDGRYRVRARASEESWEFLHLDVWNLRGRGEWSKSIIGIPLSESDNPGKPDRWGTIRLIEPKGEDV